jgi:hypothetical protein
LYVVTCFHALMKTEVRLGEFESRSVQTRNVVECLDLLENSPKRTEVFNEIRLIDQSELAYYLNYFINYTELYDYH